MLGLDEPEFALTDGFVVTIRRKPEQAFKAVGGVTEQVTEAADRCHGRPGKLCNTHGGSETEPPAEFSLFVFAACHYSQNSGDDHPRKIPEQ